MRVSTLIAHTHNRHNLYVVKHIMLAGFQKCQRTAPIFPVDNYKLQFISLLIKVSHFLSFLFVITFQNSDFAQHRLHQWTAILHVVRSSLSRVRAGAAGRPLICIRLQREFIPWNFVSSFWITFCTFAPDPFKFAVMTNHYGLFWWIWNSNSATKYLRFCFHSLPKLLLAACCLSKMTSLLLEYELFGWSFVDGCFSLAAMHSLDLHFSRWNISLFRSYYFICNHHLELSPSSSWSCASYSSGVCRSLVRSWCGMVWAHCIITTSNDDDERRVDFVNLLKIYFRTLFSFFILNLIYEQIYSSRLSSPTSTSFFSWLTPERGNGQHHLISSWENITVMLNRVSLMTQLDSEFQLFFFCVHVEFPAQFAAKFSIFRR